MAYASVAEFDVDLETHRRIVEAAGGDAIPGLIVHAAGPCEAGVRSIDVWEAKEHADQFFAERLMPAMATLGIPGGPPVSFADVDASVVIRGS